MPDITLCSNETCPINYKCYRFLAEPNKHWQSYSYFIPEDGVCKDFSSGKIPSTQRISDRKIYDI